MSKNTNQKYCQYYICQVYSVNETEYFLIRKLLSLEVLHSIPPFQISESTIMNSIQHDMQNKRYRKKYKYMKLRIKSLILENAALCDEVAKVQESILIVKDERRFLLHKLLEYENDNEISQVFYKNDTSVTSNGSRTKIKKRQSCDDAR